MCSFEVKCTKTVFCRVSALDPTGEAPQTPSAVEMETPLQFPSPLMPSKFEKIAKKHPLAENKSFTALQGKERILTFVCVLVTLSC